MEKTPSRAIVVQSMFVIDRVVVVVVVVGAVLVGVGVLCLCACPVSLVGAKLFLRETASQFLAPPGETRGLVCG